MSTVIALLVLLAAWAVALAALNHHDAPGRRDFVSGRRTPPRSHVPDTFEPCVGP